MANEDDVKEVVETTTEADSSPVETEVVEETTEEPTDAQQTPEESDPSEKETSKAVPYERFKEVNDRNKFLEEVLQGQQPAPTQPQDEAVLDPEVEPALNQWYTKQRSAEEATKFISRHPELKEDLVLDGTVRRLIAEKNAKGEPFDHEEVLTQAQKEIDKKSKSQINSAKTEGVEEGQELARKKEQAGAIGDVGARDKIDESKLSSSDYAKLHGLTYNE